MDVIFQQLRKPYGELIPWLMWVIVGETAKALAMGKALLEDGVYVSGFGFPVVPQGQARLRCQISAAHERADLDRAVDAFVKVGKKFGVI